MLARLRDWLFDGGGPENLPQRVRQAIRLQQERSEIIIGWVQLLLVALVATVYESTSMPTGVVQDEVNIRAAIGKTAAPVTIDEIDRRVVVA